MTNQVGTATGGGGAPRRLRSPRAVARRIRRAAVEIAASPASWESVVNDLRSQLGQPRLPLRTLATPAPAFLRGEVSGAAASLPLERLEPLAGGGMNTVLRSADLFAGRSLVVRKHLPAESAVEEAARRARNALVRERMAVLPRHPVIQRYWASGAVEGEACDVFDFAPGMSLARYAADHGFTYGAFLDVGYHAARGLLHLQRHGFVHGDVKPENFCVTARPGPAGDVAIGLSIIDFDIVSAPEEQLRQYALGNSLDGTLPYMPPENFRQDVPEDPDAGRRMVFSKDVFALGLTLIRLANGRFPDNFYTSVPSLLQKKVDLEEMEYELPPALPRPMQELVRAMGRSDWQERPSLSVVVRILDRARRSASPEERKALLCPPAREPKTVKVAAAPPPAVEAVGPYRLVDAAFAPRPSADGQTLPLAELADPFGRRLVGVPFAFLGRAEEQAFYEERSALLKDLNAVRLKHPELFPGSFRDLVRQERAGQFLVWIVRPLLEGALDLTRYLAQERPGAPVRERVASLRRVAEALAVLEEAGYTLPRLTPELIFFVPLPPEHLTATKAAMTRPIRRLFDVPAGDSERRFRQELMGTAGARRTGPDAGKRIVADLLDIAQQIGVYRDLGPADQSFLYQLATVESWRERVDLLVWIEMQCP